MRKLFLGAIIGGAVLVGGGIGSYAAYATSSGSGFQQEACVQFGHGPGASGNVMLYNWDDSQCPAGTYLVKLAPITDPDPAQTAPACNFVPTPFVTESPSPTDTITVTPSATGVSCK